MAAVIYNHQVDKMINKNLNNPVVEVFVLSEVFKGIDVLWIADKRPTFQRVSPKELISP